MVAPYWFNARVVCCKHALGWAGICPQVLDGRPDTKWLDFGGGAAGQATWLEVRLCVLSKSQRQSLNIAQLSTSL
jgi:hypothetical protein